MEEKGDWNALTLREAGFRAQTFDVLRVEFQTTRFESIHKGYFDTGRFRTTAFRLPSMDTSHIHSHGPALANTHHQDQGDYAFLNHSAATLPLNLPPNVDDRPLARQKRKRTRCVSWSQCCDHVLLANMAA